MDLSCICRTCLGSDSLLPLFDNFEDKKRSAALFVITGLKAEKDDGLPQQMCMNCVDLLTNSLQFRHRCREAETKLLELKQNREREDLPKHLQIDVFVDGSVIKKENYDFVQDDDVKFEFDDVAPKFELDAENSATIDTEYLKIKVQTAPITSRGPRKSKRGRSRVTCKHCQKQLLVQNLGSHMAKVHPAVDESRTNCEECGQFVLKDKLNRHMAVMHGGKELNCEFCDVEFDTRTQFLEHKVACDGWRKKRKYREASRATVECEHCHKSMQRGSLKMHVNIKHAGLGPVCEHCGRKFGNKRRLDEHLRAKHGHEKFKCSYCDFTSAAITALRNHERRHRGEKPFVCEECGVKFHAAYLLAQHKHSHRTDKQIKCEQCSAVFKTSNNLHIHRGAVHGASLHRCTHCTRSYSCRHYAVKHLRSVHRFKGPVPPLQVVTKSNETET